MSFMMTIAAMQVAAQVAASTAIGVGGFLGLGTRVVRLARLPADSSCLRPRTCGS